MEHRLSRLGDVRRSSNLEIAFDLMEDRLVSENLDNDSLSDNAPRSYAKRGALMGCVLGLLAVWRLMSGAIDSSVTDHSPMFSAAVMIVCIVAVFILLALTLAGFALGSFIKRAPEQLSNSFERRQEFGD